jgi:hypothetical protein
MSSTIRPPIGSFLARPAAVLVRVSGSPDYLDEIIAAKK